MRAPFREHVTRHGVAKVGYDTKRDADTAGYRYQQVPYRCGLCGRWHLGGRR